MVSCLSRRTCTEDYQRKPRPVNEAETTIHVKHFKRFSREWHGQNVFYITIDAESHDFKVRPCGIVLGHEHEQMRISNGITKKSKTCCKPNPSIPEKKQIPLANECKRSLPDLRSWRIHHAVDWLNHQQVHRWAASVRRGLRATVIPSRRSENFRCRSSPSCDAEP